MVTPRIQFPVVPVLYNVIHGNLTLTELREGLHHFRLCLIALTTLPETEHPFGINRSLTRQSAIAGNDLVEVLAGNEIIIHVATHLTPDAKLLTLLTAARLRDTETAIRDIAIGLPLNAKLRLHSLFQWSRELPGVRVPGRTPSLGNDFLASDIHLHITGIIENELIEFGLGSLHETFIDYIGTFHAEVLREILDASRFRLIGNGRSSGGIEFEIDGVLSTYDLLAILIHIGSRKMSCLTILVVKLESTVELQVIFRISKAAIAVAVPQNAIAIGGKHERNAHLRVILEEVFVLALHIKFLSLMLSQTIKCLLLGIELQGPGKAVALFFGNRSDTDFTFRNTERLEGLSVLSLLCQLFSLSIKESDASVFLIHTSRQVLGLHEVGIIVFGSCKLGL